MRSDLFPTRGGSIRAVNPYTQNPQRRVSRKHVGSLKASSNLFVTTGGTVFQRANHKDVSFVQVESTTNSKRRISHNLPDKPEVFLGGHEQVHIISVHNQSSQGQTTTRYANQMLPHTHTQRLNAEIVQNRGQGVTLLETHI